MNIYVSNLGYRFTDDDLNNLFSAYGTVNSAKVITDKMTNQSRGFGFVEMPEKNEAIKAMSELNGTTQDGRAIQVTEAKPKKESSGYNSRW